MSRFAFPRAARNVPSCILLSGVIVFLGSMRALGVDGAAAPSVLGVSPLTPGPSAATAALRPARGQGKKSGETVSFAAANGEAPSNTAASGKEAADAVTALATE